MATTFGAVIRDYQLIKTGLLSELVGLLLCLMVGFIFGTCLEVRLIFIGCTSKYESHRLQNLADGERSLERCGRMAD